MFTIVFVSLAAQGEEAPIPVGTKVILKDETVPLKLDGKDVDNGGPFREYTVEEVKDGQARLVSSEIKGWVAADQVIGVDAAVEHFTGILKDDPKSVRALVRRALAYYLKG